MFLANRKRAKASNVNFVMEFEGEAFKVENPKASRVDSMISGHF